MSDLTEYLTEQLAYIMPCPNCGVTPEPELNDEEDEICLECGSCGFSSLWSDTVDDALRSWEEMCEFDEYLKANTRH